MTRKEAARILDPETTVEALAEVEYYNGFSGKTAQVQAVSEACEIAAAALREWTGWISVKDALPEPDVSVLVIVNGKPHENITLVGAYELAEFDSEEGWILEMWPEWMNAEVSHWMPLPEPPGDA